MQCSVMAYASAVHHLCALLYRSGDFHDGFGASSVGVLQVWRQILNRCVPFGVAQFSPRRVEPRPRFEPVLVSPVIVRPRFLLQRMFAFEPLPYVTRHQGSPDHELTRARADHAVVAVPARRDILCNVM